SSDLDGSQVIVRGEINVYPPSGKYQIIVKEMRLAGIGELLLKLEELKFKLKDKGYFKAERKRPLPKFPRRIGIVTSPTGAAIQDILNILSRRFAGVHIILNPVKVQGEGAAQEIAQAIRQFNDYQMVDVMIVGRGGGSMEDLWAFNEEIVAEAIYRSQIPVISAVGHETDHCIADYVADVRAPTPSAAAELVIAEKAHQLQHLVQIERRMQQTLQHLLRHGRQRLEGFRRLPLFQSPYGLLGPWMQRLDTLRQEADLAVRQKIVHLKLELASRQRQAQALKPTSQVAHLRRRLSDFDKSLQVALLGKLQTRKRHFDAQGRQKQIDLWWQRIFSLKQERLRKLSDSLHAINPKNLLAKGYAILLAEKGGTAVTSVDDVAEGDTLRAMLADGELVSTIKQRFPK
ncbi:MAG: exodeoxyribonuclease VII large subunit, partial [Parachlamydia sp.]|nr:exodeoxyribonuclease VII large subunit [Parachlamydia sp.]